MSGKKIIAVIGATGAQGGGLVHSILNDPNSEFIPRAITRKPESEKAQQLKDIGVEVVYADADNLESLKEAFKNAYGAYCVTAYWEYLSPEKEKEHAGNMAEAAKDAKVSHVIWSTLEDTRLWVPLEDNRMPTLMEKYKVPHFDAKGEANNYFIEAGVPTTFLVASFYWDNLIYFGMGPKKDQDGKYFITFPMGNKKLAGIAAEDIGKCAYGIFKHGKDYIGSTIGIAGDHLTGYEMADKLSKALNKEVTYKDITPEKYRSFGFPGADDLGNMFQFYRDFEKEGLLLRDLKESRKLNPELQNFDTWLAKNKNRIQLE
jgi:uncharacterized protein YbjT (DUF2867 family)